jgi:pyruvate/2-oxoglutarate dehydrogenase complex dihydrolipoamide acyltransferase (E2) component
MKRLFRSPVVGWPAHLLALGLLLGASPTPARQIAVPAPLGQPGPVTYPVQAPVHGHLVDLFFTAGDRVKRGQVLAKLKRPDGTPTYFLAPVAGRIGPAQQKLGEHLPAHTTLAVIETGP